MTAKELKEKIKQIPKEERDLQKQKPEFEVFDAKDREIEELKKQLEEAKSENKAKEVFLSSM